MKLMNLTAMKKVHFLILTSILVFALTEISNAQRLSDQKKVLIEQQIDSVFQASVKVAEQIDYNELSKGVDDRHNAGFIVNRSYYPQYKLLIEKLKEIQPEGARQSISVDTKKITVLSEKIALLTASGTAKGELGSGQTFNAGFLWSFVYEKIDNKWKVIQSHQSSTR